MTYSNVTLRASSLSRSLSCFPSAVLSPRYEEKYGAPKEQAAATRGSSLHSMAAQQLRSYAECQVLDTSSLLKSQTDTDEQDLEHLTSYLDYVKGLMDADPKTQTYIEESMILKDLGLEARDIPIHIWGTPDAIVYNPSSKTLHVVDFKTGRFPVSANDNPQLMTYAHMFLTTFPQLVVETVNVCIVQRGLVDRAAMSRFEVEEWVKQKIAYLLEVLREHADTGDLSPHTHAGPHCQYCSYRPQCVSYQRSILFKINDLVESSDLPIPIQLTISEDIMKLSSVEIFKICQEVAKWFECYKEHLTKSIELGEDVPGIVLSQRRLNVWDKDLISDSMKSALQDQGIQLFSSLLSVAELKKAAKAARADVDEVMRIAGPAIKQNISVYPSIAKCCAESSLKGESNELSI